MASTSITDYVTLVSRDGFEFKIQRSAACASGAIRRMLDPTNNFAEAKSNRCVFENINGVVLEKVCEYLYYNEKHKDATGVPDMDIPPELCLELLMAADYLNGESLKIESRRDVATMLLARTSRATVLTGGGSLMMTFTLLLV